MPVESRGGRAKALPVARSCNYIAVFLEAIVLIQTKAKRNEW